MPSTDVHTHLAPSLSRTVEGVGVDDLGRLEVDGHRIGAAGLYDAGRLAGLLAEHGVDRAWVSAPPPFYRQGLRPEQTRAWVWDLDDGLRERLAGADTLDRLGPHYLSNLLGNPVETGVAVAQLVLGGVLTRHPDLRIVLVHCGGVVPALVGRWSRGVATRRPGIAPDTEEPATAVRRLWSDCLGHRPEAVDLARATFGDDHLLLGSDYPFPMGLEDPFEALSHLPPELRRRIAGNAQALVTTAVAP